MDDEADDERLLVFEELELRSLNRNLSTSEAVI